MFVLDEKGNVRGEAVSRGKQCAAVSPEKVYNLALSTDNLCRLVFDTRKNTACFTVDKPLENVRIVVRNYPEANGILLDGKPVEAVIPCDCITQGFKTLYMQSAPVKLAAGEHTLKIASGAPDNNFFLPAAMLVGPFAVEKQSLLKPLPSKVTTGTMIEQGLSCFTGKATYTAMVDIPESKSDLRLKLNSGGLYTSASLGDTELGERAWGPYEWSVPAQLRGKKVELSVSVWTSVLPMFGDWKHSSAGWDAKFWVPPASGRNEVGLVSAPEWIEY